MIKDRRQIALKLLEDAEIAFRSGRPNEALTIKSKLFDDYSRYKDLADLFPATPANVPGSPATSTSPPLDAASPVQAAPPTASGSEPRRDGAASRGLRRTRSEIQVQDTIAGVMIRPGRSGRFAHFAPSRPTFCPRIP